MGKAQAVVLARSMGVQPTDAPMDVATDERQKLMGLNGPAFDREFVRYMIKDHQEDIADFRKEAEARDGRVSAFARKTLPVLHKHLDIALRLRG
jgi:putative membrane protein